MEFVTVCITLFLIMDPFGNTPVFLSILEKVDERRRRAVIVRELLLALVVIVLIALAGRYVMSILGLREESVAVAGGLILFLIALRMVFPGQSADYTVESEGDPLLVPLAVPLVAGPSVLAALMLFSTTGQIGLGMLLLAAGIAWFGTFIVLLSSTYLLKLLTRRGLIAVERLMGMVLVALAVQMFMDGISRFIRG